MCKKQLGGRKLNGKIKDVSKHTPGLEFETKIRFIPERLYAQKAREAGKQRLDFMVQFFKRLKKELNGELLF